VLIRVLKQFCCKIALINRFKLYLIKILTIRYHLGLYCTIFRSFESPNQRSFAVDKVMIKESYYY